MYSTEVPVDSDIQEIVPLFYESRMKDLGKIHEAISDRNFGQLKVIAHTIKGISAPYGYPTLERIAKEMEVAALHEDSALVTEKMNEMEAYLKRYQV